MTTSDDALLLPRLGLAVLDRLAAIKGDGRVVLVSSALRGEGKSFVAGALARQFRALNGGSVLLVDASLSGKPHGGASGGFAGLLATGELGDGAVRTTDLPGLWQLPAGVGGADADQVLFRPGPVSRALQRLCLDHELVVVDAPVLARCGSLAMQADAVVLIVDAQRTSGRRVQEAIDTARLPLAQIAGVVLNRQPSYLARWFGA